MYFVLYSHSYPSSPLQYYSLLLVPTRSGYSCLTLARLSLRAHFSQPCARFWFAFAVQALKPVSVVVVFILALYSRQPPSVLAPGEVLHVGDRGLASCCFLPQPLHEVFGFRCKPIRAAVTESGSLVVYKGDGSNASPPDITPTEKKWWWQKEASSEGKGGQSQVVMFASPPPKKRGFKVKLIYVRRMLMFEYLTKVPASGMELYLIFFLRNFLWGKGALFVFEWLRSTPLY